MFKKLALTAAALTATPSAAAANINDPDRWELLGDISDTDWYISKDDIGRGSPNRVTNAWIQTDGKEQMIHEVIVDCRTETYRFFRMVKADGGGSYNYPTSPMERPVPGSAMENVVNKVCT